MCARESGPERTGRCVPVSISENILDYHFSKLVRMMGIHYEGKATYLMSEEIVKIVI